MSITEHTAAGDDPLSTAGAVPGWLVSDLLVALGYAPPQIESITATAETVTVRGIALHDGKPYLTGHGRVAEFVHERPIDWRGLDS